MPIIINVVPQANGFPYRSSSNDIFLSIGRQSLLASIARFGKHLPQQTARFPARPKQRRSDGGLRLTQPSGRSWQRSRSALSLWKFDRCIAAPRPGTNDRSVGDKWRTLYCLQMRDGVPWKCRRSSTPATMQSWQNGKSSDAMIASWTQPTGALIALNHRRILCMVATVHHVLRLYSSAILPSASQISCLSFCSFC